MEEPDQWVSLEHVWDQRKAQHLGLTEEDELIPPEFHVIKCTNSVEGRARTWFFFSYPWMSLSPGWRNCFRL